MFRAVQLIFREKKGVLSPTFPSFVNGFSTASNSTTQRLAGKVAVITGGASGIGKATAAAFIKNGAKVIVADVQDDLGRAVATELGPDAAYTRCDVTDEAQIAAAVDNAVERHGHLDILYSNAGIAGSVVGSVGSLDLADYDRVMAVNARAALAGVKHAARVMAPRRRGSILCTASTMAVLTTSPLLAYAVSKASVLGVVRATAGPLARDGVRVNAISPHGTMTPFMVRTMAELVPGMSEEEVKQMVERERDEMGAIVLEAEDIANAAVYLASDEAKYVTGHNLIVDGGYTAHKGMNMTAR